MALERLIMIDGYNLIHRTPELRPGGGRTLREAREKLLNLLSWAIRGPEFLVVFDGAEGPGKPSREHGIEVQYSKPPEKADDLIRRLVEDRIEKVERLTVVTADIEVARHARAMGADVALSDLFLAGVLGPGHTGPGEKPVSISKKDLEEWIEIFGRKRKAPGPQVNDEGEA